MARRVRDKNLDTREARLRLPVRAKCHWRLLDRGLHLGYRRLKGRPGSWTLRAYVGNGRYLVERIGTADDAGDADGEGILDFSQAQEAARQHVRRRREGNGTGVYTVRDCVEAYVAMLEHEGRSRTAKEARARLELHALPVLGDLDAGSLDPAVLRAWLAGVAKKPALMHARKPRKPRPDEGSPEAERARRASANKVRTYLFAAFNHAHTEGKVAHNSWTRCKPFKNVDAVRVRFLTVPEARRLINSCEPAFRNLVRCALACGCRYSELCRLQVLDFNPDAGSVHIRKSKSGKDRHIALNDEACALFAELCAGKAGDQLVLVKADGGAWRSSDQTRLMGEAVARAKISPPITFHGLRHSFASLAAMNGMTADVGSKALGHADTNMWNKHYAHLSPSYVAAKMREHAPTFGFEPDPKLATLRGRS